MSDRETARLTADVVALAMRDGVPHVLLIRRRWEPFAGKWALPGGHVDPGEAVTAAACREFAEETGITVADPDLLPIGVYSAPGRDPRGRYVTFVFLTWLPEMVTPNAGDDAAAARWIRVWDIDSDSLAFDHAYILDAALVIA